MNLRELVRATNVAARQIRYLIAEGFVPSPRGGRANAEYGEDHVSAIDRYMRLRELGFPPAAIKVLMRAGEGAPFVVAPGVTLVIDPALLGSGGDVDPLLIRLKSLLTDLLKESPHASDRAAHSDRSHSRAHRQRRP